MQMNVTCINYFSVCLRDRDGKFTSAVLIQQIPGYHGLRGTKWMLEYVNCDALARIEMTLLNKLLGTTGRARKAGFSRDGKANTLTFSIHHF
jgi:hypothetical protein